MQRIAIVSGGSGAAEQAVRSANIPPRKKSVWANSSALLLRSLLRRIIRMGSLTLVAPDGRTYDGEVLNLLENRLGCTVA